MSGQWNDQKFNRPGGKLRRAAPRRFAPKGLLLAPSLAILGEPCSRCPFAGWTVTAARDQPGLTCGPELPEQRAENRYRLIQLHQKPNSTARILGNVSGEDRGEHVAETLLE